MASNLKARPLDAILADLAKVGFGPVTIRAIQDVIIRSDKTLTDTGGLTAKTPLPGAVDANGNLLLKNVAQANAVSAGPTTNSVAFVVIPEMTQTITPKGNKVLVNFDGTFQVDTLASLLSIAIFRDGVQLSYLNLTSAPGVSYFFPSSISWIDTPTSGVQHTYDVRWKVSAGIATAVGTNRALQIVELG